MAFTLNEIEAANAGAVLRNNPNGGTGDDYDEICTVLEDPNNPGEKIYFEERLPGEEPTAATPRYPVAITHPRGTICLYATESTIVEEARRIIRFSDDNQKIYEVIEYGGTELCMGTQIHFEGQCYRNKPLGVINVFSVELPVYASAEHTAGRPEDLVLYGKLSTRYIGHQFKIQFKNVPVANIPVVYYCIVRPFDGVVQGVTYPTQEYETGGIAAVDLYADCKIMRCSVIANLPNTNVKTFGFTDGSGNNFISQTYSLVPRTNTELMLDTGNKLAYYDGCMYFVTSAKDKIIHYTMEVASLFSYAKSTSVELHKKAEEYHEKTLLKAKSEEAGQTDEKADATPEADTADVRLSA